MPGEWGALPPEENSAGFWLGPGAESFLESAMQLVAGGGRHHRQPWGS